jgi:hypothetical protein
MARIDIKSSSTGGGGGGGNLQLSGGASMSATLTAIADTSNTASPLKLSTTGVQSTSKIQITTAATSYIDAEDNSGNNRFTVGRDPSSQLVTVDFASVPTALTTPVGAIRTATDGTNLANIMTFLENGVIGVGTDTPDTNALIDITSTTKGFLPPRMTNTQRAAITATKGLIVINTTNNGVAYNDGTNWGYLSGANQTVAGAGGTTNIAFPTGNIALITLTASTTYTFSGHAVGTYILKITQGGSGSYTVTWPGTLLWSGGTAPTLTATVGKTDIITIFHDGTSFYGTYSLNY